MSKTLLNPEQSANLLGVTRPGFVKMYRRGDIEAELTSGRQAFFTPKAVRELKKKRDAKNGHPRNNRKPAKKR